jgi:hypothetical protein
VYTGAEQLTRIHKSTRKVYFITPDKWEVVTQHTTGQKKQREQEVKWRKEASKGKKGNNLLGVRTTVHLA